MPDTTLRRILAANPCYDPRQRGLLPHDHDLDAPITIRQILDAVDLNEAIWCLKTTPELTAIARRFALDCAERVRHLMEDPRSTNALDVVRRHLAGKASDDELAAARAAAWDAAWDAARAAAWAAARAAARDAAWDAAWAAARDAAWAAAWAAAKASAWDAARDAEREWQAAHLVKLTEGENP